MARVMSSPLPAADVSDSHADKLSFIVSRPVERTICSKSVPTFRKWLSSSNEFA
jgi:hypothetical protein